MGGHAGLVFTICICLLCAAFASTPWRYMPAVLGDGYGYIGEASAASGNEFGDATVAERVSSCGVRDLMRLRMIQTGGGIAPSSAGCDESASAEQSP
jgi:hypothetical protein